MPSANRNLALYWLAIGVPAVLFALGGLRLLQIEARRGRESGIAALRLHAGHMAEKYRDGVNAFVSGLLAPLADIETTMDRRKALQEMANGRRFITNTTLWRERDGIPPRMEFWERRVQIDMMTDGMGRRGPRWRIHEGPATWRRRHNKTSGGPKPRQRRQPGQGGGPEQPAPESTPGAAAVSTPETGVGEWTVDGKPRLVGWLRLPDGDSCTVEIDPEKLFADNPDIAEPSGGTIPEPGGSARKVVFSLSKESRGPDGAEASLAPLLKNWYVRADFADGEEQSSLPLAGACLLVLLVFSLFAGAALLVRDARRQRREALMKTDFVSNVSHELKTPLTAIRLWTELMAGDRLKSQDEKRRAFDVILSETNRLSRLVGNLLDFGRLERKRRKYTIAPLSLRDAAEAAVAAAGCGGNVSIDPEGDAVAAADADAVRQILVNLLDNASKYAPGAPVRISCGTDSSGRASMRVADSGPGFPPGCGEKIFERFYRVDDSVTAGTGGSGLGLSIARSLARGMDGDLTAESVPGKGAAFTLSLPPAPAKEEVNG